MINACVLLYADSSWSLYVFTVIRITSKYIHWKKGVSISESLHSF